MPSSVVRSDRRYQFAVAPDELWVALTRTDRYRSWWPWLRGFDAEGFTEGARWSCEVQPPLPYTLRFELCLEEVVAPRFVTATVTGDIVGHAALDVTRTTTGSEVRLISSLGPNSTVLRAVAALAGPVARFGHDWVLDTGLRQFRRAGLPQG